MSIQDAALENYKLLISFIILLLGTLSLAMLRHYMLMRTRNNKLSNKPKLELHNKLGHYQYLTEHEKNYSRILRASNIVLFLASIPVIILTFMLALALSGSILVGIICAVIFYIVMVFVLRNKLLLNQ